MEYSEIIKFLNSKSNGIKINPETNLFVNGIIDSLGLIELITLITDKYSIEFDAQELVLENFENTKKIISLVSSKL